MSLALWQTRKEINKEQHRALEAGCLNGGPDKGIHSSALAQGAE